MSERIWSCMNCGASFEPGTQHSIDDCVEYLKARIADLATQLRFLPVEEQPPDKEGEYIAICEMIGSKDPFRVIVFWDNALGWCFPFIGWRKNTIVTHYLRVPKRDAQG